MHYNIWYTLNVLLLNTSLKNFANSGCMCRIISQNEGIVDGVKPSSGSAPVGS